MPGREDTPFSRRIDQKQIAKKRRSRRRRNAWLPNHPSDASDVWMGTQGRAQPREVSGIEHDVIVEKVNDLDGVGKPVESVVSLARQRRGVWIGQMNRCDG